MTNESSRPWNCYKDTHGYFLHVFATHVGGAMGIHELYHTRRRSTSYNFEHSRNRFVSSIGEFVQEKPLPVSRGVTYEKMEYFANSAMGINFKDLEALRPLYREGCKCLNIEVNIKV